MIERVIKVRKEGIILRKTTIPFENEGVLNPAVMQVGNEVHLFYRAVREGNNSTIGYSRLKGPLELVHRNTEPLLNATEVYESKGVEDARTVCIDGTYYLSYTAYDGINALGALATSTDLITWNKHGIIVPLITYDELSEFAGSLPHSGITEEYFHHKPGPNSHHEPGKPEYVWDKNVVFFPRRIGGKLAFFHRMKPDMQLVMVTDLKELTPAFWEDYFRHFSDHIVMKPKHPHELAYLGAGCPPIETDEGWLVIYHGVWNSDEGHNYTACAALFDLEDPTKEIARLPYPLFIPEMEWEKVGEVNNVCFPTGTALFGDTLYLYYGAADEQIACASVSLEELVMELLLFTTE